MQLRCWRQDLDARQDVSLLVSSCHRGRGFCRSYQPVACSRILKHVKWHKAHLHGPGIAVRFSFREPTCEGSIWAPITTTEDLEEQLSLIWQSLLLLGKWDFTYHRVYRSLEAINEFASSLTQTHFNGSVLVLIWFVPPKPSPPLKGQSEI